MVLLHYQAGNWTSVNPPAVSSSWDLNAVHFTSADEGWAVGQVRNMGSMGALLHYKDGVWTSITPPTINDSWYLYGVHFTSADEGWAVGGGGIKDRAVLLHYHNGMWASVATPTLGVEVAWDLYAVHFTSPDEGWAVGGGSLARGVLFHYQKGRWTLVNPPAVSNYWCLLGIHFASATEGWAVGYSNGNTGGYIGALLSHVVDVSPSEGTIGTKIRIDGSGFGSEKGKVLIGGRTANIDSGSWTDDMIIALATRVPSSGGPYDIAVVLSGSASKIVLPGAFTVKDPELDPLPVGHGLPGASIAITGKYFSSKKGKVYLGDKKCKVITWEMNANTGESTASFVVPKKMPSETYNITLTNKVGSHTLSNGFTIP
jgi:hypothetical protein